MYILYGRPLRAFPDFSIYLQSTYSVYRKDLLMGKLIFAMFNPENICVEVNLAKQLPVSFDHQKCDTSIHLNNISNIYYLTRFTKKTTGLYVKLIPQYDGLQKYVKKIKMESSLSSKLHFISPVTLNWLRHF